MVVRGVRSFLVLLALLPGCGSLVETAIATAPNHGRTILTNEDDLPGDLPPGCSALHLRCDVGSPPASLSTWVIDPAPGCAGDESTPRATILVLHGFHRNKKGMLRFARPLLEDGYRAVLVDLRGHGRSTGEYVAFGALEAEDLSELIDRLEGSSMLREPVGVFGISYGAAVAIQLAARDRRVRSVVAVAPFTSLQNVVPRYVRLFLPVWGWFASAEAIRDAVLGAGMRGGFDPELASPLEAIRMSEARTLLIHGDDDFLIPSSHSERLHAARPDRSELLIIPGVGHNGVFHDSDRRVTGAARSWFEKWLVETEDASAGAPDGVNAPGHVRLRSCQAEAEAIQYEAPGHGRAEARAERARGPSSGLRLQARTPRDGRRPSGSTASSPMRALCASSSTPATTFARTERS